MVTATTSVGWVYRASFGVREGRAWFAVTPRLALEWGVVIADESHTTTARQLRGAKTNV
ncbi:MAG: hypothetical protein MUE69_12725 [Myxococcota bacterium]|nr:hypothetical protein [Myxococcota bacterium]